MIAISPRVKWLWRWGHTAVSSHFLQGDKKQRLACAIVTSVHIKCNLDKQLHSSLQFTTSDFYSQLASVIFKKQKIKCFREFQDQNAEDKVRESWSMLRQSEIFYIHKPLYRDQYQEVIHIYNCSIHSNSSTSVQD